MGCHSATILLLLLLLLAAGCRTTPPADPDAAGEGEEAEADDLSDADLALLAGAEGQLPDALPEFVEGGEELDAWDTGPDAPAGGWLRSGEVAKSRARLAGLPLVVWMSHGKSGPDQMLAAEVMGTGMRQRLDRSAIGLRIDYSNDEVRRSKYYRTIRDRYEPRGFPTVLVILPDGTEVARRTGYEQNTAEEWLRVIDADIAVATKRWQKRLDQLRGQGFRTWRNRTGREFFGRALGVDDEVADFIDPYGGRWRVPLAELENESLTDLLDKFPPGGREP